MKKQFSNLDEWLDWQQTLHSKNIDFKLERIKSVYKKLKINKIAKKVIIVAGTNGKGSTVALLENILHENGFNVGSFTSPHMLSYNERIKINNKEVETKKIIDAFEIVNNNRGKKTLTYFEFATLAAFYLFHQHELDFVILEVGLGGRLDATNIIDSDISIITSIGIDHVEFLGSTVDSIALEKAGVMRPFCQCIFAQKNPPTVLLSYAKKNSTNFLYNGNDFSHNVLKNSWSWKNKNFKITGLPLLSLTGSFQYYHAAAALSALHHLSPDILNNKDCLFKALKKTMLLGRYQVISKNPEIILDVAHNADASSELCKNLSYSPARRTVAVIGILGDKDVYSLVKPMKSIIDSWYCGTIDNERGMNSEEIKYRISSIIDKQYLQSYPSIVEAYSAAVQSLHKDDRLIVYGSFYTVSEILKFVKFNKEIAVNM
ncbi:MAG: bifunctional tetrahydrofolate synthase/dihydrofolate synthase [Gammaproteobacteria bacterium]|nr:bifunctional tetrahydrofolate synthase/dihydrofolate synthase [Gammaproteobacteria bacterium]|tara:strand:+ start:245 stop:1537 length:1293 start_codon:yes stop_codon:yes gene_type:complete